MYLDDSSKTLKSLNSFLNNDFKIKIFFIAIFKLGDDGHIF